jgi:MATE family multidrug resistance protein
MTLIVAMTRSAIPYFFLGQETADAAATIALAATLLVVGATFFIADGVQTIAAGALRGLNDTRVPLGIAAVSFWVIGFSACYTLAFTADLGAIGVWIGLSASIAIYAVLLVWRFHALTGRHYLPELAKAA